MNMTGVIAVDDNWGIGKDNKLPWRIPEDLKWFKATTMGHALVMGRKTYEGIGRPLPGRKTFILTRQDGYQNQSELTHVITSMDEVARLIEPGTKVFLCGGAEIYSAFMSKCEEFYVTHVKGTHDVDTTFDQRLFNDLFKEDGVVLEGDDFAIKHYVPLW